MIVPPDYNNKCKKRYSIIEMSFAELLDQAYKSIMYHQTPTSEIIVSHRFLNIMLYFLRCRCGSISLDYIALSINKEFGEIPFNTPTAKQTGTFFLQVSIYRVGIFSIDLNFSKHWKTYPVSEMTEFFNFCLRLRFLCLKLIAGKT